MKSTFCLELAIVTGVCVMTSETRLPGVTTSSSYDSLNRLTNTAYTGGSAESYAYDSAGNRLQRITFAATQISPISAQTATSGVATASIPFTISNPNVQAVSLTVSGKSGNAALLPQSSFVFGGSGVNRTLTITPIAGQAGRTTAIVIASDGSAAAATTFQVTVFSTNRPPIAIDDSVQRPQGQEIKVLAEKLLRNDSDPDGDPLTLVSVSSPSAQGGTVSLAGPWVVYTPPSGYNGTDTFTYTISDGRGGTAAATVTVSVQDNSGALTQNYLSLGTLPNGNRNVQFMGIPGLTYSVQASTDMVSWVTIGTRMAGPNGSYAFEDVDTVSYPTRFYRSVYP